MLHFPWRARLFIFARRWNAACAAGTFSARPAHVRIESSCSARAYENDNTHGAFGAIKFIALRWAVASTELWPPDRKLIDGTAAGTVRRNTASVARATSSEL